MTAGALLIDQPALGKRLIGRGDDFRVEVCTDARKAHVVVRAEQSF
jgi:hypothetical protein